MKKPVIVLAILFITCGSVSASETNLAGKMFIDGFLGGLVGTMIGGATMLLTHHPSDHTDNLRYGAGIGVIAGSIYGVADYAYDRSVARVEDGKVKFAMPSVMPEVGQKGDLRVVATLVSGKF